jgi:hypothetical protein
MHALFGKETHLNEATWNNRGLNETLISKQILNRLDGRNFYIKKTILIYSELFFSESSTGLQG